MNVEIQRLISQQQQQQQPISNDSIVSTNQSVSDISTSNSDSQ